MNVQDRLRAAYVAALEASHGGRRVEIHLGTEVVAHLRSLCAAAASPLGMTANTCWGFPVVEDDSPLHISVHTVYTIPA